MKLLTLDAIKAHEFVGNHHADAAALSAVEAFALNDTNPLAERAEALRVMADKGLGLGRLEDLDDAALLAQYIDSL